MNTIYLFLAITLVPVLSVLSYASYRIGLRTQVKQINSSFLILTRPPGPRFILTIPLMLVVIGLALVLVSSAYVPVVLWVATVIYVPTWIFFLVRSHRS